MIIKTTVCKQNFTIPEAFPSAERPVIFDIETTGLSPKTACIYLIGALTCHDGGCRLIQWLAESTDEESEILSAFLGFLSDSLCDSLIHFNGDAFDLPFLKKRCETSGLSFSPESLKSIDLYRNFRPLKRLLKLPAMNLKSLEEFLSINREDTMDGGELISVYHKFSKTRAPELKQLLLLHNHDDLLGTAKLLSLSAYTSLLDGGFRLAEPSRLTEDADFPELILHLTLNVPVPRRISVLLENGYLTADGSRCSLSIKGFRGTLKYFFEDYKNYYYLPLEDTALHKSVASYVDREHRVPAKASTCYCKKEGTFLPAVTSSAAPKFRQDYQNPSVFQECTDQFLSDPSDILTYITAFLHDMKYI